jgi:DNA-binding NtrC family response regulator
LAANLLLEKAQMETGTISQPTKFQGDDVFLLKYLPGDALRLRELRAKIYRLNTENLELIRFVLLVGDTGTGKNYVARVCAGHRRWLQIPNADDAFDPGKGCPDGIAPLESYLDRFGEKMLPAIPRELVESELFGHVRGGFTGAVKDNPGLFRDKGYQDILLDEIGEAQPFLQAKLLAVLEGRPFTPVGGTSKETGKCDKRIFIATNRNLQDMVAKHEFREDLLFRIRRCTIGLPRLSEVPELIPTIAAAILNRLGPKKFKDTPLPSISAADNHWLQRQPWRGNVRELEEVIELWVADGCAGAIEAVASTRHFGDQYRDSSTGMPGDLAPVVRNRVDQIIGGQQPSPGTIGAFIELFTSDIKAEANAALCDWYHETNPSLDILKRLFPKMKPDSIRSQMSRGRRTR